MAIKTRKDYFGLDVHRLKGTALMKIKAIRTRVFSGKARSSTSGALLHQRQRHPLRAWRCHGLLLRHLSLQFSYVLLENYLDFFSK